MDDLFTPTIMHKLTRGPFGAMVLGSILTFIGFGLVSILWDNYKAFGLWGFIGVLLMWVTAFLWGVGVLGKRVKFVRERFQKITATVVIAGNDDEQVDRNAITIRVMAENHGLKVDYDTNLKSEDVETPPELAHLTLKFRALSVHGPLHKMRTFSGEAEAYLKKIGMDSTITGNALDDVRGPKED